MIFPSLAESSGYTLIEALSCGTAIITSNLTAIPTLVATQLYILMHLMEMT